MPFAWPQFLDPVPLSDGRAWTATFDRHEEEAQEAWYTVTIHAGEREVDWFVAHVGLWWAGKDWARPAFAERVQHELHTLVCRGKSSAGW